VFLFSYTLGQHGGTKRSKEKFSLRYYSNDQLWQVHESLQIEVSTWEG